MIRRLRSAATAALFLPPLLVGACRSATEPAPERSGPLFAVVGRDELWLLNRGDRPVYTFVIDAERLALVNWAPCVAAPDCRPIQPGAQQSFPFEREYLRAGHQATVHWWYAVPGPEGPRPGTIHSFVVQL